MRLRRSILFVTSFAILFTASSSRAADKKSGSGTLTGTWDCMAHGSPQGDIAFTLYLEQSKEVVTGSVSSPMGGAEITTGSFKSRLLELQIDTQRGNYVLMGKFEKGQLSGTWSLDNGDKGTWEGKKATSNH